MRIWQKIYFITLVLFLLMLNIGLFLAAKFIFSYNLLQEQKKTKTDCYFLCQNLEHDISVLEKNGRYRKDIAEILFEGYRKYYSTQDIELSLEKTAEKEETRIYSEIKKGGRQMQIFAEKNLSEPYQTYRLHYKKRLVDFEKIWEFLRRTFIMISLAMSVLLCLLLYVFMRRILSPLDKLNGSVAQIAAGEYEQEIFCKENSAWKNDEIAELSQNVNKMSQTIRGQIQALKEESDRKQQLMDNMAHELRTPLTSIYGYAEYLRYAKADIEEQYDSLTYIMQESMRLAKMSETMLSMRLYEKEEYQTFPVNLQELSLHIEKILAQKLKKKGLTFKKNFQIETIYGEEELFVNLFCNLLENAIRASRVGDEIVWNAKKKEEKLVFEIIDHGIGMEKEEISRITEAFYRADKARSRKEGGVGLGLSVVDLIVKKLGGTLTFSSAPEKGTKVTIILQPSNNNVKRC